MTKSTGVMVAASGATQPPWLVPRKPSLVSRAPASLRASPAAAAASRARTWKSWVYLPPDLPVPRLS